MGPEGRHVGGGGGSGRAGGACGRSQARVSTLLASSGLSQPLQAGRCFSTPAMHAPSLDVSSGGAAYAADGGATGGLARSLPLAAPVAVADQAKAKWPVCASGAGRGGGRARAKLSQLQEGRM